MGFHVKTVFQKDPDTPLDDAVVITEKDKHQINNLNQNLKENENDQES